MNLTISYGKLDNKELLALSQAVDNEVKPLKGIEAVYVPFNDALQKCIVASNQTIEKALAKQESQQVKNEDETRDDLIIGLKKFIDAQTHNPSDVIKDAAVSLDKLMAKVGSNFHRSGYDKESAILETLLIDLEGDYSTQVTVIGVDVFVVAIRESQTRFIKLRQKQIGEFAADNELLSFGKVRRDLVNALRTLFMVLPALNAIKPTDKFTNAISILSETLQKYN